MPIAEWNRVLANAAFYALAMKTVGQLDCQSAIRIPRFHDVTIICETVQ